MPILAVTNLRKTYGSTTAVDGVSFVIAAGEIVGLLGPNGAGKTTTINMILGVLEPSEGTIQIDDHDLATERREALSRTNFAAVYAPLPGNLTVEQNLRVFAMLYGVRGIASRIDALLEQFDLARFRRVRCGVLSSGEQTRVCLAKAMVNGPRLLLLDEPTASRRGPAAVPAGALSLRHCAGHCRLRARLAAGPFRRVVRVADSGAVVSLRRRVLPDRHAAWLDAALRTAAAAVVRVRRLRAIVTGGGVSPLSLVIGGALAITYALAASVFFTRVYRHAVRTGLIARYSAESVS